VKVTEDVVVVLGILEQHRRVRGVWIGMKLRFRIISLSASSFFLNRTRAQ
jgi:hypothetical protein